jgi:hypothetical protein
VFPSRQTCRVVIGEAKILPSAYISVARQLHSLFTLISLSTSRPQIGSLEKQVIQNIKKKGFLYLGVLFQSFSSSLPTTGSSNTGRNSNQIHRIALESKTRPLSQSRIIISTRLQHRLDTTNLTQQRTRCLLQDANNRVFLAV